MLLHFSTPDIVGSRARHHGLRQKKYIALIFFISTLQFSWGQITLRSREYVLSRDTSYYFLGGLVPLFMFALSSNAFDDTLLMQTDEDAIPMLIICSKVKPKFSCLLTFN